MKTIKKISNIVVMVLAAVILTGSDVHSQWTQTGSILYPNNTSWNIGIGTTSPSYKLDVSGDVNIASGQAYRIGGNFALRMSSTTVKAGYGGPLGSYNALLGCETGNNMGDDGAKNTFVGYRAGYGNGGPDLNTFIGYQAGYNSNNGEQITCVGAEAGYSISTGGSQTFVGYRAGYSNTSASFNVFVGNSSGWVTTTGTYNVFVGTHTGYDNTASYNTFIGNASGRKNTSGNQNVFTGYVAGYNNTTGYFNTFNGASAGYENTTSNYNTFLGFSAGKNNTTGEYNTAVGANAGDSYATCSNSTFLGYGADANGNYTNCAAIGNGAVATGNNIVYIGNANALIHCAVGNWSGSDGRFKFNVQENVSGLEFIKKLRPVTYQLNTREYDAFVNQNMPQPEADDSLGVSPPIDNADYTTTTNMIHAGFIAQEVEQAAAEAEFISSIVHTPLNDTDPYALNYAQIVVPLVKAVQEQQTQIEAQQAQIEEMHTLLCQCCASGSNKMDDDNSGTEPKKVTSIDLRYADNAILYQNTPNPFGDETTINYYLPQNVGNARLVFYNDMGQSIKEILLDHRGNASVKINSSELAGGFYSYSLMIDEKIFETKRMLKK